jgi:hypothetical protein
MAVFVVLSRTPNPRLDQVIKEKFANDAMQLSENQWLVSFSGTAVALSTDLGITGEGGNTGSAIVAQISSYYGRASSAVWDWIKAKLESANG